MFTVRATAPLVLPVCDGAGLDPDELEPELLGVVGEGEAVPEVELPVEDAGVVVAEPEEDPEEEPLEVGEAGVEVNVTPTASQN